MFAPMFERKIKARAGTAIGASESARVMGRVCRVRPSICRVVHKRKLCSLGLLMRLSVL